MIQRYGEEHAEEGWCQFTPLFDATLDSKLSIKLNRAHAFHEGSYDAEYFGWTANLWKYLEQTVATH